ncbi:hypothetical protein [Micromonospora schwarzwaldensis]|uniref:hypothetical protein n=1 Tax=Micromonospora sp. DSM 45708 TaxID=3111767 RepID=UPI0031DA3207
MPRLLRVLLVTALLGAALTGCDDATAVVPGRAGAAVGEGAVPSAGPVPGASLPIAALEPTLADYQRIQRARLLLARRCMARLGIDLAVPTVRPVRHPGATAAAAVGAFDDREPARYGYRGPVGYQSDLFTGAVRGLTKALVVPEPGVAAFDGSVAEFRGVAVPAGGCEGETRRALDTPAGSELRAAIGDERVVPWTAFAELEQAAAAKLAADDRYRRAQRRWSGCMARSGYHYPETTAAEGDGRWATSVSVTDEEPEREVSAVEIATAVADERCRAEVGLPQLSASLLAGYQTELIRREEERLRRVRRLLDLQLASAARVTGAGGGAAR